jgi:hypothetical protein
MLLFDLVEANAGLPHHRTTPGEPMLQRRATPNTKVDASRVQPEQAGKRTRAEATAAMSDAGASEHAASAGAAGSGDAAVQRMADWQPTGLLDAMGLDRGSAAPSPLQSKETGGTAGGGAAADPHAAARCGFAGSGGALPFAEQIQRSFGGHDIGGIQSFVGGEAAVAGRQLGAEAYASGQQIGFSNSPDLHTAAHEAAHVVQQRQGVSLEGGVGRAGDPYERQADAVADRVVRGESAEGLLGEVSPAAASFTSAGRTGAAPVQRYGGGTGVTDPKALIPVAKLIEYVSAVETAYSSDTSEEIITRLRIQYYDGAAFQSLIPDAHYDDTYWFLNPDIHWSVSRRMDKGTVDAVNAEAYDHLAAHADENGKGDNPSPYVVMPDGSRIDLGHMLLGLDALIHPRVGDPYSAYGIPSIDPSSWVADLGIAAVWMTQHQEKGSTDSPVKLTSPDLDAYYRMSAPTGDLLGDVDSFGMHDEYMSGGRGTKLSVLLRKYYLGTATEPAGVKKRWQTFATKNGLRYARSGSSITWDASVRAMAITRVDTFNDMFDAGMIGSVWQTVVVRGGGSVTRRSWPHTPAVVDKFLTWVKSQLETELASAP